MKKTIRKKNNGYTIIETMIAVSLFVIIVMTGMGSLLNANLLHQKSQSMRSIIDSLTFVMEDMSRNLRVGYNYHCILPNQASLPTTPKSCTNGVGVAFEAPGGVPGNNSDQWLYYINAGKIFKSTNGGTVIVQVTPDEVVLDQSLGFSVLGAEPPSAGDSQQPFMTIRLVGHITVKNVVTPFSLQTSVSQRLIDI
jgi:Tfp pilus assembly protein PilW